MMAKAGVGLWVESLRVRGVQLPVELRSLFRERLEHRLPDREQFASQWRRIANRRRLRCRRDSQTSMPVLDRRRTDRYEAEGAFACRWVNVHGPVVSPDSIWELKTSVAVRESRVVVDHRGTRRLESLGGL